MPEPLILFSIVLYILETKAPAIDAKIGANIANPPCYLLWILLNFLANNLSLYAGS